MKITLSKKYTLDDLPRFSPWPARLLGVEPWEQKHKTKEEIIREYEHDKWGPLLNRVKKEMHDISLEKVEKWMIYDMPDLLCSIGKKFDLLSAYAAHERYLNIVKGTLEHYLPASSIVELGCGYGSIILYLAKKFSTMPFLAAEYTKNGMELTDIIAKAENLSVNVGYCDFTSKNITTLIIPENSIIYTSYATPYVRQLQDSFVEGLCKFNPKAVIHFEPCYEHCDSKTLFGLMRKRYIEVNDYNVNLATLLYNHQQNNSIKIIYNKPLVFGKNPLLAISVLVWTPRYSKVNRKIQEHTNMKKRSS
jgi:hypothetical protein